MPKFLFDIDEGTFACDNCGKEVRIENIRFNTIDLNDERYVCFDCTSIFISKITQIKSEKVQLHILYRHYDRFDQLLYIGITNDPVSRFSQHRQFSAWYLAVIDGGKTTYERFENRQQLLEAERIAIMTQSPRYNVAHSR